MRLQCFDRIRREWYGLPPVLGAHLCREMFHESRNVVAPLAQRRQQQRENVDAVKQILAEFLFAYARFQIAVGRDHHPNVYGNRFVAANPLDHQARFDLALALNGKGQRADALEHLIAIVKRDRKWNDDGARKQLVQFFDAWGPTDEATIDGRKRLSSILFA